MRCKAICNWAIGRRSSSGGGSAEGTEVKEDYPPVCLLKAPPSTFCIFPFYPLAFSYPVCAHAAAHVWRSESTVGVRSLLTTDESHGWSSDHQSRWQSSLPTVLFHGAQVRPHGYLIVCGQAFSHYKSPEEVRMERDVISRKGMGSLKI